MCHSHIPVWKSKLWQVMAVFFRGQDVLFLGSIKSFLWLRAAVYSETFWMMVKDFLYTGGIPCRAEMGGFAGTSLTRVVWERWDDTSDIHTLVPAELHMLGLSCLALCEAWEQGAGFAVVWSQTVRMVGMGGGTHSPSCTHAGKSWCISICFSMFWWKAQLLCVRRGV